MVFQGTDGLNIGAILFQGIILLLIILFIVSLTMFVRRMLINQETKAKSNVEIEQKLNRIIELLEKEKVD